MSPVWLVVAAVLTGCSRSSALSVIAGDAIDFQCVTEKDGGQIYLPDFQRQDDDGDWETLYVGSNPKFGTDTAKWLVTVDDSIFHYRLRAAALADGGRYRCDTINVKHHPLSVVATTLECSTLGDGFHSAPFSPVCRVETSGPEDEGSPKLKWVVGTHEDVEKELTANATSAAEATLTEELTEEHHGKVISCFLDAVMPANLTRPSCILGPLNISSDVKISSDHESRTNSCQTFEVTLSGNPAPALHLVTVEDVADVVEESIASAEDGDDVVVHLRACDLSEAAVAVVKYDGVELESFTFGAKAEEPTLAEPAAANPGLIVAVVAILLLAAAGGTSFYFWKIRNAKKGGDEEAGPVVEEEKKEEEEEEKEEEKEDTEEEKEEEVKDVNEEDKVVVEMPAETEKGKDADAEAEESLKAKLSVLEDVEGVKMIDDSLNEGKDEETPSEQAENVEV